MSYARFSRCSDVYLYPDVDGGVTCCWCSLNKGETQHFSTLADTLAHCDEHEDDGDCCGHDVGSARSWLALKAEIEACPDVKWS